MQLWTKILPFFIVEWIAKKHLERWSMGKETIVEPFKGVYFVVEKDKNLQKKL